MRPCGSGAGVRIDGLFAKEIEECDGVPTRTAQGHRAESWSPQQLLHENQQRTRRST